MNRRSVVFYLGVFGAIGALATANAADASARSFVAAIYNAYKGRSGNGIALDTDAALRRYFEPGLAALISKDRKEAADQGEAPTLTGDPFVDAADWNIADFDLALAETGPDKATATVKFDNDQMRTSPGSARARRKPCAAFLFNTENISIESVVRSNGGCVIGQVHSARCTISARPSSQLLLSLAASIGS
jgi:hypothetical protein